MRNKIARGEGIGALTEVGVSMEGERIVQVLRSVHDPIGGLSGSVRQPRGINSVKMAMHGRISCVLR